MSAYAQCFSPMHSVSGGRQLLLQKMRNGSPGISDIVLFTGLIYLAGMPRLIPGKSTFRNNLAWFKGGVCLNRAASLRKWDF